MLKQLGARAALAKPADVDKQRPRVVVNGTVVKRDSALVVAVDVIDGPSKQRIGQVTMPVPASRHLAPEQLAELGRQVEALAAPALAAPLPGETPPPSSTAATGTAPSEPPSDSDENGAQELPPSPQAEDKEKAANPAPLETSTPAPITITPPPPPHRWLPDVPRPRWYPFIEVSIGAIVDSRNLKFRATTPPTYTPGTGGGVHADLALYPFAWSHALAHGLFAGLGGFVLVDKPFWPTTKFSGTPNQYDTDEFRVEGGARWRFIVRKWRPRLELSLLGGGGKHSYTIAKAVDPATGKLHDAGPPDVDYVYGFVGAGARIVVWRERLMPWASLVYEYFPDAGPVENVDEFGTSSTHGLMLRGGLDVRVWKRLRVGASAFLEVIGFSFSHDLPTAKGANKATDEYFGGIFTVGYDY